MTNYTEHGIDLKEKETWGNLLVMISIRQKKKKKKKKKKKRFKRKIILLSLSPLTKAILILVVYTPFVFGKPTSLVVSVLKTSL